MSYQIDFNKPVNVHFIGIGGISMSALAEILLERGFKITGSDMQDSEMTEHLRDMGIFVQVPHSKNAINKNIDVVVMTAAIHDDNEELIKARELNIPIMTRAELLGEIMDNYNSSIAVSGTHGKTTTTSMLAGLLLEAGLNPTITVGGLLDRIGGNLRIGGNELFLSEACEYMNSFLTLRAKYGVILNIEEDHLDFFKDINDIRSSFSRFIDNIRPNGALIINASIDNYMELVKNKIEVKSFAVNNIADLTAIIEDELDPYPLFHLEDNNGKKLLGGRKIKLAVPGVHNVENALAALLVCQMEGLDLNNSVEYLENSFHGAKRRFEKKGVVEGVDIYDDYAHHPSEIKATLKMANRLIKKQNKENNQDGKLYLIFQPHTYTRTKALFNEFIDALSNCDHLILADIYAAREQNTVGISSEDLARAIADRGISVTYLDSFKKIEDFVLNKSRKGDMLITMGAGNVVNIGENLLNK